MTMAEINTHLENVDSWELAPREAIDAFEKEMADKQYGRSACLNAWLWFYTGWCAR